MRGDCNADSFYNLADPIFLLNALLGDGELLCLDACDPNDDGSINIADAIYQLLNFFGDSPPPVAPFPACGSDPTNDDLDCALFPSC